MALDRGAVEELGVRPHRGDGRHLVDRDLGRGLAAQHSQERDRRIVAALAHSAVSPPLATR